MSVDFGRFQTSNEKLKKVIQVAGSTADAFSSVLIQGENGIGKKTLALLIAEKGHFPGLKKWNLLKISKEDLKDGDICLIENICDFSMSEQAELLEAVESFRNHKKVRWISTSTKNLIEMVSTSEFRRDLFYRLSVIQLQIPSLRERVEDFEALCDFFVKVSCHMQNMSPKILTEDARVLLRSHLWPGNVTELENVIERAVCFSQGSLIQAQAVQIQNQKSGDIALVGYSLSEMEKRLILQTLQITGHNKTKAAYLLGISIRTLRNKLNEYREVGAPLVSFLIKQQRLFKPQ